MNGSGKSGLITSVEILRKLLTDSGYLNNPIAQKNLDAIVNKKTGELFIETEYLLEINDELLKFRYDITLLKSTSGKYVITHESLSFKKATSKREDMDILFEVFHGEVVRLYEKEKSNEFSLFIQNKTVNLLSMASMPALFYEKIWMLEKENNDLEKNALWGGLWILYILGRKLYVYLDQSDNHREYVVRNSLETYEENAEYEDKINSLMSSFFEIDTECLNVISSTGNIVPKKGYAYLKEMVLGGIVFIDEFDSNLHDVYLCALLEYLMEYGEGQLCFTTHNVGPMDVLKSRKKSIDFLSENHNIYSWTKSGNYSPSKLYRNGMIEGSPFKVDSIDFIGVFS